MIKFYVGIIILGFTVLVSCQNSRKLIFVEDFDGNQLNTSVWNYELGDGCPKKCGWGNNEIQFYTKENITVNNGNLVITATKDSSKYKSGRITTANKFEFQYGTIEVRAKLPLGKGVWPAIWLLGHDIASVGWPACGEIDFMEYAGKNTHEIHTTLHTPDSHGKSKNTKVTRINNIENGFHVYKCHWTKKSIEFFVDDQLVYTFNPEVKNERTWPFNKPFYVILNLAIGGNFGGPDVDDSIFPQEFLINFYKVN